MRIFLVGFMGCGKTTVGKKLAKKMELQFLDLDHHLEQRYAATVAHQFQEVGEAIFREREREALAEICVGIDNVLVSTGGGAPCFYDNMELMKKNGITIYLKMTPEALASRLANARKNRPLLQDKSPEELLDYISTALMQREPFYESARIVVSALSVDVEGLVDRIYRVLKY